MVCWDFHSKPGIRVYRKYTTEKAVNKTALVSQIKLLSAQKYIYERKKSRELQTALNWGKYFSFGWMPADSSRHRSRQVH